MSIPRRLPSAPLLALMATHHSSRRHLSRRQHAESLGISYRTLERMRREGSVSFSIADRLCVELGQWLDLVYGPDWDQAAAS